MTIFGIILVILAGCLCFMGELAALAVPISIIALFVGVKAKQNESVEGSSAIIILLSLVALYYSAFIYLTTFLGDLGVPFNLQPFDLREYIKYILNLIKK